MVEDDNTHPLSLYLISDEATAPNVAGRDGI